MADPKTKTPNSLVGMLKWNPASGKWFVWDGTITVSGSVDTELPAAAALADATVNPTVPGVSSFGHLFNGATWDRMRGTKEQGVFVFSAPLSIRLDDGATYLYVGKAAMGSATSSAVWQIQRITQADTTVIWADGDAAFNNVWDNRASLSYS